MVAQEPECLSVDVQVLLLGGHAADEHDQQDEAASLVTPDYPCCSTG